MVVSFYLLHSETCIWQNKASKWLWLAETHNSLVFTFLAFLGGWMGDPYFKTNVAIALRKKKIIICPKNKAILLDRFSKWKRKKKFTKKSNPNTKKTPKTPHHFPHKINKKTQSIKNTTAKNNNDPSPPAKPLLFLFIYYLQVFLVTFRMNILMLYNYQPYSNTKLRSLPNKQ